jgi:hypothetical protein
VTSIRRVRWPAALFLVAMIVAVSAHALVRQAPAADLPAVPCRQRVIAVQLSSSDRAPTRRSQVIDLLETSAISATVCDTPVVAYGVAGGAVVTLVTSDDVAHLIPAGPLRVRQTRFRSEHVAEVRNLVTRRLDEALKGSDGATTTVVALYHAVSEHAGSDSDVILVTDGVNHDDEVDLNRRLVRGEGRRLAASVDVPTIGNRVTTVVGLGQVDSRTPVPGRTWSGEIHSFNQTLCLRSGAGACRLYSAATTTEVLLQ